MEYNNVGVSKRNPFKWKALTKAVKWYFGNSIFGLLPLLVMLLYSWLFHKHESSDEVYTLINSGIILFAALSIMGAAFVDIINEGYKPASIWIMVALFSTPFIILGIVITVYGFIVYGNLSRDYFTHNTWIYYFIISFSLGYSIFAKYLLY